MVDPNWQVPPWVGSVLRAAAAGVVVVLLLGELALRMLPLDPPGVVRASEHVEVQATSWGVTWHGTLDAQERRRAGCPGGADAADRLRVDLVGGAVLHSDGVSAEDSMGPAMQRAMGARVNQTVCVENLAEPGLPFSAQTAAVRLALYGESADALVWSVAPRDVWPAVAVGPDAWNFGPAGGLDDQAPRPMGLPGTASTWALAHSHLLGWAAMASAPRGVPTAAQWDRFLSTAVPSMATVAAEVGATLLVVTRPDTHRPFVDQTAAADPYVAALQTHCAAAGVAFLDLSGELGDTAMDALRGPQTAGTFDNHGVEALAELTAPTLETLLRARATAAVKSPGATAGLHR